jgi:hypothetical protein
MQVELENFKFVGDIVVMDMAECPVTLGRPFLATPKVLINLEYKEMVLRSKGEYLIHHISQESIRQDAGIEFHVVETIKHQESHRVKEPIEEEPSKGEKGVNINTSGKLEGAIGGS